MLVSLLRGIFFVIRTCFKKLFRGDVFEEEKEPRPLPTDEIRIQDTEGDMTQAEVCGHYSYETIVLNAFGITIRSPGTRYCGGCLLDQARKDIIPCAKCGLAILPGDHVVLYKMNDRLAYASRANEYNDVFIGCLDMDCAGPAGMCFAAGTWNGEAGFVPYRVYFSTGNGESYN